MGVKFEGKHEYHLIAKETKTTMQKRALCLAVSAVCLDLSVCHSSKVARWKPPRYDSVELSLILFVTIRKNGEGRREKGDLSLRKDAEVRCLETN